MIALAVFLCTCCIRALTFENVRTLFVYKKNLLRKKMALTFENRSQLQVAWLGFPGGVGNGLVQHVVGDPIVSPPEHAQWFDERLALMPLQVSYHRIFFLYFFQWFEKRPALMPLQVSYHRMCSLHNFSL